MSGSSTFNIEKKQEKKAGKAPFSCMYMLILLLLAVLVGGFRVHFTGLGAQNADKLNAFKRSGSLEGFIYRSVWNKEDRMLFVNSSFKAVADVSGLEPEQKETIAAGAFVKLTHYYIYENDPPRNPGVFNYRRYLLSRGVTYSVKIFSDGIETTGMSPSNAFPGVLHAPGAKIRHMAGSILIDLVGSDFGALTAAVMTGDTGALDDETKDNFRNGGVSHLLAVSGMHVAFILLPFGAVLRNRKTGFKARKLLLLIPVTAFIGIADFSSSVMRAGIGAVFRMAGDIFERPYNRLNATCLSAAVQIFLNPYVVFSTGFILSYASVLALIFIAPGVEKLFTSLKYRERRGVKKISAVNVSALCAGISVNIALMPLNAYMFGSISPVGLITTLYASPLSAGVCIGGYALFLCGLMDQVYIFRPLRWVLKQIMKLICRLITLIAGLGSRLSPPIGRIETGRPPLWLLIMIYAVILVALTPLREPVLRVLGKLLLRIRTKRSALAIALVLTTGVVFLGINSICAIPLIEALVIDVGQGSAMLVKAGGFTGLVDTGTGKTDIAEVVRAQGVNELDFVVISHAHSDHAGGLAGVLSEFEPATLFVSGDNASSLSSVRDMAVNAGWNLVKAAEGDIVPLGPVTMSFIVCDAFFGGRTDADENNSSLCVCF